MEEADLTDQVRILRERIAKELPNSSTLVSLLKSLKIVSFPCDL